KTLTTYRCGNCWPRALAELRGAVTSGEAEVRISLCDFLARRGYGKDAETIRAAPAGPQQASLLAIVDALQAGHLIFDP
ncbi:MAG TPA: hypothetical protein VGQ73_09940, partial [Gemmatimonadales bacterium]|nr:hypothetical protein [Gemmatimonadales bacterium]